MDKIKLFYSYSHKDERFRDSLETHLKLMTRKGIVLSWHDRRITAGSEWKKQIDTEIRSADIILLLISSDFIASDYCYENELEIAMELNESNQAIVIPIILRPSDWGETPFSKLQALPKDAKAISLWDNEDEAWLNVVSGLKLAIDEINNLKSRKQDNSKFHNINNLLKSEIKSIDTAFKMSIDGSPLVRGIKSGFSDFDQYLDGLHLSNLTVVASRSESLRSSFVTQIASHVALNEKIGVAYFSFNLSADRLIRRLLTSEGKIPSHIMAKGMLNEFHWPSLSAAVGRIKDSPLHIDDTISLTLEKIRQQIEKLKQEGEAHLIILDGVETLFFNEKDRNEENKSDIISKKLRLMAKTLNASFLITSNIDRSVDQRIGKRPFLEDLHSVGMLNEIADNVIFLYRDDAFDESSSEQELIEAIISKNSFVNTNIGTFRLIFFPKISRFESVIDP